MASSLAYFLLLKEADSGFYLGDFEVPLDPTDDYSQMLTPKNAGVNGKICRAPYVRRRTYNPRVSRYRWIIETRSNEPSGSRP